MAYLRVFLIVLILTSNTFADWYILLPKKRHSKREIPKNIPIPKLKSEKVQPKPYSIKVNKISAPNFSIPLMEDKRISKSYLYGKNTVIIFVKSLFSPFTESIVSKVEKVNLKNTNFVVISINDSDFALLKEFKKLLHIQKTFVSADSYIFKQFRSKLANLSAPSVIIIDKFGFIRFFSPNIQSKTTDKLTLEVKQLINIINKG